MTANRIILFGTLFLGLLALAAGFGFASVWAGALLSALLGLVWAAGEWRGWSWAGSVGLFLLLILSAISQFAGVALFWAIIAVSLGLAAWETGRFIRLLEANERIDNQSSLENKHRRRLLIVVVLGAALSGLAALVRLDFGFAIALPLACLSVLGFSLAINFLRRSSD